MTISITVPSVTFTNFVSKVLLPYIEDAVSFQLYGGDAASSTLNRTLNPTANSTLVGTPAYASNFATISNTVGFDTGFLLDTPFTQVFVGAVVSGGAAPLGRAPGAGGSVNMVQNIAGSTNHTLYTWPNGAQSVGITVPAVDIAEFCMLGSRWGGSGTKPNVFTRGASGLIQNTSTTNVARTVTPTLNLRVGACGTGAGSWRVAATAFYGRVLSDVELLEVYAYLKGLLAYRGVTIL